RRMACSCSGGLVDSSDGSAHAVRLSASRRGRTREPAAAGAGPHSPPRMRRACEAAASVLEHVGRLVAPGVTTDEIDAAAHAEYLRLGGYPSTLNYRGFPKSLCTSVNE